ncbi:complex I 24 kDa subunit family protein [Vulgatibacter incomptus]|uniref:NADH-ubiquinone oxidoreductase chain E n=1 Tax=Vulgatibacter incomptus TaxID=1391653 RepID=A0A0K1P830_9BACT|nr:NAD(P)H-dependent oxidoreductase subunit E [Vulgatibacter incomptus]AKU89667.1 NADH-ubiquinone oxidoreductase chain E [Vulgatibacter incomptus]
MAAPFTAEQQKKFDEEIAKHLARFPEGRKAAAILPGLHIAQDILGWLSPEAMLQVAQKCESTPERVREVASFYVMYFQQPKGKHVIDVCTNISCSLRGAETLIQHLEQKLGVHMGETTGDQLITLREFECLGACGNAPVLQVDSRFHMDMTLKKADQLVEDLRKQAGKKS